VTVRGAAGQLTDLINEVRSLSARQGIVNSLDAKLEAVRKALNAANAGNRADACNKLGAFINEAQAQAGKAISSGAADRLIAAARQIKAVLDCP